MPRLGISRIPKAAGPVGDGNLNLPIKTAGPAQGGGQGVGDIGRADHDQVRATGQPVHQRKQLSDDTFLPLAHHLFTAWRAGVEFVQKDDAGPFARGFRENVAQVGFAFPIELVDDFRPADGEKVGFAFRSDGPRDEGLAAARRAVPQDPAGRVDAEPLEDLRVPQRPLDHFPDTLELGLQPAHVPVSHREPDGFFGPALSDDQFHRRCNEDRP